jgi:ABC-type methionine transport system permease subunit
MTRSTVMVWLLVALGVACGLASAIQLVAAHLISVAPSTKLLQLDIDRDDSVAVLVYRSIPFLILSVLILATTSIVVAAKKS